MNAPTSVAGAAQRVVRQGRHAFLEQLVAAGVRYVFGNPGTTEQALVDALQDYPELELVLALHEGVAVGAAEGFARAADKPAFVLLHTAPGLGNAMGMLSNAHLGGTPMVVYVGDMPRPGRWQEPALSGPIVEMARPVARWVHEVATADEIPQVLRRAFKVSMQHPRGPVVVVVPADVMEQTTTAPALPVSHVRGVLTPDAEVMAEAADLVAAARNPAIIVADGVASAGGQSDVARLAEVIGAPIYQGYATEVCTEPGNPLDAGALPLFRPDQLRERLAGHDCLVGLGTAVFKQAFPSADTPLDPGTAVVQIAHDPWELAKNQPALAIQGDPARAARELTGLLKERVDANLAAARGARATVEIRRRFEAVARQSQQGWDALPLTPARAVAEIVAQLPKDVVVVDESVSAGPWLAHFLDLGPGRWFRSRGGGLGAGMALPIGVSAARPGQPVVAFVGDGSAMYTITSLWTAAHRGAAVTWIVLNNRSYRMLKLNTMDYLDGAAETRAFVGADLTDPPIDFVQLARSMGVAATRAETPDQLMAALRTWPVGPRLVEVVVDGAVPSGRTRT